MEIEPVKKAKECEGGGSAREGEREMPMYRFTEITDCVLVHRIVLVSPTSSRCRILSGFPACSSDRWM